MTQSCQGHCSEWQGSPQVFLNIGVLQKPSHCDNPLFHRQLKKLSEDSLTKQPEEVFDVLEKLGEG